MRRQILLLTVLLLAGCSTSGRVVAPPVTVPVVVDDTPREPFDMSPYVDEPAPVESELVHDVPERLMRNQIGSGAAREVSGFRVQVFSSLDLTEAASSEDDVKAFWQTLKEADPTAVAGFEDPGVYRFFRQPYYRIRVGDYTSRTRAERVAKLLSERFPGAFVVPDRVTVRN